MARAPSTSSRKPHLARKLWPRFIACGRTRRGLDSFSLSPHKLVYRVVPCSDVGVGKLILPNPNSCKALSNRF